MQKGRNIVGYYFFASVCTPCCSLLHAVGSCCAKIITGQTFGYVRTGLPTLLGIVASAYKTVIFIRPKRWLWQFTQPYLKRHFWAKMNCAYFYVTPFPLPTRLGFLQLGLWRKNGWLRPCHRGNLSSLSLNSSVSSFTYHSCSLTRGTFRQVPTSELVYLLWNVPIQIFVICYIILEVYDGFRCRKGLHSTLGWYII